MRFLLLFLSLIAANTADAQSERLTNYTADAQTSNGQLVMCTVVFEHFDRDPIGLIKGYSGSFGLLVTERGDMSVIAKAKAGTFTDNKFDEHALKTATFIGNDTDSSTFQQFEDDTGAGRLLMHQINDVDYAMQFMTDMFAGPMLAVVGLDTDHSMESDLQPALITAPGVLESYQGCVAKMMNQATRRLTDQ